MSCEYSERQAMRAPVRAIPILAEMGIRAISIGQNSGSPIPQTNTQSRGCFVWRDEASGTEVFYLDVDGYGWCK